ncbi:ParB/RepB/Spo0J family partition protein [Desulfosarcina cetonica]|uniref:ParB/RepB/Spo0J family partition protein n=1 Tax=Desulfosarcina cetonica TaxID=90730 RepID=UPI00155DDE66|nr:ParB/RepB/Spo0J family partition protein [Desulfosarcina cetonica]
MSDSPYITIPPQTIGERYADLRIIQPVAENAMERSMQNYGQLTPVVVGQMDDRYEMVDGFKRLRAGRKLGYEGLQARVMPGGQRAMKAAIIYLNTKARTLADIESALVIRSLYREDHLSQIEIATLLNRHKSYVCRRLALAEKLGDDVMDHLKLGLINITIGRELSRLPAGNQAKALTTVLKYGFTGSETAQLVRLLLKEPGWNHEVILGFPEKILSDRHPPRPRKDWCDGFHNRLVKMDVYLSGITTDQLNMCQPERVVPVIERIQSALAGMHGHLKRW